MGRDTIVSFSDPVFHDTLSDLVCVGARRELDDFLAGHAAAGRGDPLFRCYNEALQWIQIEN